MVPSRRAFLEQMAGSAALIAAVPTALHAMPADPAVGLTSELRNGAVTGEARALIARIGLGADATASPAVPFADWDLSWTGRLKGKYKAVMDVPEVESGYGVWRGSFWVSQYGEAMAAKPADCSSVVVLRHNGIALAMNQQFWDAYGIGKKHEVKHPVTQAPTDRNPAMLSSTRGEVPAQLDDYALDKFIARGGVALACNLAFDDCVGTVAEKDKLSADAARAKALTMLIPGVILQPSGVFAAIRAQQAGCVYVRAS